MNTLSPVLKSSDVFPVADVRLGPKLPVFIFVSLFLVPVMPPLVTDEASLERELLPDDIADVGLGK